jgi:uncharacterized protein YjcR
MADPTATVEAGTIIGRLYMAGMKAQQIADLLGFPSVSSVRKAWSRTPEYQAARKLKKEVWLRIVELRKAGHTLSEIAETTGMCIDTVAGFVRSNGVVAPDRINVEQAWRDYCGGMSLKVLQVKYGMAATNIRKHFEQWYGVAAVKLQLRAHKRAHAWTNRATWQKAHAPKPVVTPMGRFGSAKLAAIAHRTTPASVRTQIFLRKRGWYYASGVRRHR